MMDMVIISRTIEEAERFLIRARRLREWMGKNDHSYPPPIKATSACRRASMDLTRALADLRRYPNQKE